MQLVAHLVSTLLMAVYVASIRPFLRMEYNISEVASESTIFVAALL